jgi:hypothetical protein
MMMRWELVYTFDIEFIYNNMARSPRGRRGTVTFCEGNASRHDNERVLASHPGCVQPYKAFFKRFIPQNQISMHDTATALIHNTQQQQHSVLCRCANGRRKGKIEPPFCIRTICYCSPETAVQPCPI